MEVNFAAWIKVGHHVTNDWEISMEISEEEFQRLLESAKKYGRFEDDESVRDIYDKVYRSMVEEELEFMDKEDIAERMADYLDISEEEAETRDFDTEELIDLITWEGLYNVGYPVEIDEILENDEPEEDL